jgi:hypothetical protein
VLLAWPGYLSYFNELAGGKVGGPDIALDSNFDWGVDLYRLKLYVDAGHIDHIYVLYWGYLGRQFAAKYLGAHYRPFPTSPLPPGELLAVSANYYRLASLSQPLEESRVEFDLPVTAEMLFWLRSLKVVGHAGDSIVLLQVPSVPGP